LFVSFLKKRYGATISAPHMHAMALELLESRIQPSSKILDVGSGKIFNLFFFFFFF